MSPRPILLDTHAAVWLPDSGKLSNGAEDELQKAQCDRVAVYLSPISAWEVGILVARGRIALPIPPANWFDGLIKGGLAWAPLSPEILISSSLLPGRIHGDPADRVLAATARAFDFRLMTRDRRLLDYGAAGHLQTISC